MAIFELTTDRIVPIESTSFGSEGVRERADLQPLLRANIEVVSPDTMIIAEEFGDWSDGYRRIDLLGIDRDANLVVIELKRSEDGGHMELQAIRYASMVSTMTLDQAISARSAFQKKNQIEGDAEQAILEHLAWHERNEERFGQAVRIVLVSGDFSKELTSSVMWLNSYDLDIRCVRLRPYKLDGRVILDVQQIIPLPEAAEYQVQVREKTQRERQSRESNLDITRFDVFVRDESETYLTKRGAIHYIVKSLVDGGIAPTKITEVLDRPVARLWRSVDGNVDSATFRRDAEEHNHQGAPFLVARWTCDDDELIAFDGKTFAFSNQWGGEDWHDAMKSLTLAFPEFSIQYSPSKGKPAGI